MAVVAATAVIIVEVARTVTVCQARLVEATAAAERLSTEVVRSTVVGHNTAAAAARNTAVTRPTTVAAVLNPLASPLSPLALPNPPMRLMTHSSCRFGRSTISNTLKKTRGFHTVASPQFMPRI